MGAGAGAVDKSFNQHRARRGFFKNFGQLSTRVQAILIQASLIALKQNIAEDDDYAALGFLGRQVGQLGFKLRRAALGFERLAFSVGGIPLATSVASLARSALAPSHFTKAR
jgi:hypothetical protein